MFGSLRTMRACVAGGEGRRRRRLGPRDRELAEDGDLRPRPPLCWAVCSCPLRTPPGKELQPSRPPLAGGDRGTPEPRPFAGSCVLGPSLNLLSSHAE